MINKNHLFEVIIYESEVGNAYSWKKLVALCFFFPQQVYFSYNKGAIFIPKFLSKNSRDYFKFDLDSKTLIDIDCYRENFALKKLENNIKVIEYYGQTFQLGSELVESFIDKGDSLCWFIDNLHEIERLSLDINQQDNKKGEVCYNKAKACFNKAKALSCIGKNIEAIEYFNQAITLNPKFKNEENWLYIIADTLHHLERYLEAIEYCNEAIKLKPQSWKPLFKKGLIFYDFGKCLEAIECYNEAIKLAKLTHHDEINFRKGCALYNLGMNIEAIECYNKAIEINNNYDYYYFNRAIILSELGQEVETLKDLNRAYDILNESDRRFDSIIVRLNHDMLRVIVDLQASIVGFKDKLKKMQDKNLEQELFKEYEVKWQRFKIKHSKLLKRAFEVLDWNKVPSIKESQQLIKEFDQHYEELINIIHQ